MATTAAASAALLVDIVRRIISHAWRDKTGVDGPAEAIEKVVDRAVKAALDAGAQELRAQLEALGLKVALMEAAEGAEDVLDAFRPKGTFPKAPWTVEIVDKLEPESEPGSDPGSDPESK
jgi:hypothetical protein